MKVQLRLFARARDLAGREEVALDLPETATVRDVKAALADRIAELRPLVPSLLFAVGNQYASDHTPIPPGSEVACFPPVSGG